MVIYIILGNAMGLISRSTVEDAGVRLNAKRLLILARLNTRAVHVSPRRNVVLSRRKDLFANGLSLSTLINMVAINNGRRAIYAVNGIRTNDRNILSLGTMVYRLVRQTVSNVSVTTRVVRRVRHISALISRTTTTDDFRLTTPKLFIVMDLTTRPKCGTTTTSSLTVFTTVSSLFRFGNNTIRAVLRTSTSLSLEVHDLGFRRLLNLYNIRARQLLARSVRAIKDGMLQRKRVRMVQRTRVCRVKVLLFRGLLVIHVRQRNLYYDERLFLRDKVIVTRNARFSFEVYRGSKRVGLGSNTTTGSHDSFRKGTAPYGPKANVTFFESASCSQAKGLPSTSVDLFDSTTCSSKSRKLRASQPIRTSD